MRGKTIQVFLTDGTPRGIKTAEITSNIEQALFIPRNKLSETINRPKTFRPGVYFLFGDIGGDTKPIVYIGQSRNCFERIKSHDQKKDFWNYAVIIISKTDSFSQTHIEYLEQLSISKAYSANRYTVENSANPKPFKVSETMEADLLDNFDTIKILLSTLGFPLFESIAKNSTSSDNESFYCKGKFTEAEGNYIDDGFVVFKGSTLRSELTPTTSSSIVILRKKLIESNVIKEIDDKRFVFQDDFLFGSPSAAASQVLGRNANGWKEWKKLNGLSLDKVVRSERES